MDAHEGEVELRREAIRRRLQQERACDICRDLKRSRTWFDKWWARYCKDPRLDFRSGSRAPETTPRKTPAAVRRSVVRLRRAFEQAATPATRYGLIGHRTIQAELERLGVRPLPSLPTIQRILRQEGLTHARGSREPGAYYPQLLASAPNAIHATDIITKHLPGGRRVQNFHTIDIYSHAAHLTAGADKTSTSACRHLLESWADLGLPLLAQFDNEDSFCGGHTHVRVVGKVVRSCLFLGVQPLFIPFYEAKRNHWVEGFHALWVKAFWSRFHFTDLCEVQREERHFRRWYHTRYRPPSLLGKTPCQLRDGYRPRLLTPDLRRLIPDPVPITAGFAHFIRRVAADASIIVLNQRWAVGRRWIGQYVWARLETESQMLSIWHQSAPAAAWQRIKDKPFPIAEPVHRLTPAFRRKCPRCPDHWPS